MATTRTETLNTFTESTVEHRRKNFVTDGFFGSAPFWAGLAKFGSIRTRGGSEIRLSLTYAGFTASSFGRGDTFDTDDAEFIEPLIFDYRGGYSKVVVNGFDAALNEGPEAVFDIVNATMENAELSLVDDLSTQAYADGTGNNSNDIDGLANAVTRDTSVAYGGVTRATTANTMGSAVRSAVQDTTGGALSYANVNTAYGDTTIANEEPNLITTTQTLRNRIWERSQPSERSVGGEDTRSIGFRGGVRFNNAVVQVDSHCPTGFLYLLNMKYWSLYVHQNWDFRLRGMFDVHDSFAQVGQFIFIGNAVCRGPRFQGVMSGLT